MQKSQMMMAAAGNTGAADEDEKENAAGAEIFKEIQVLVIDQGTILDRIDYNIEQAADRVGHAVVELDKANKYQKRNRMMLCIYMLLLLCGFMIVVLIMKKAVTAS